MYGRQKGPNILFCMSYIGPTVSGIYWVPPWLADCCACVQALQSRMERLRSLDGCGDALLRQELEGLRLQLRCGVCQTRHKSVIITKCWHMFCKECIDTRLSLRDRKCPGCSGTFGKPDVQQFYFT
jgi:Zinc finger, C3HC4 type (RING finger)